MLGDWRKKTRGPKSRDTVPLIKVLLVKELGKVLVKVLVKKYY
jgi:hypothetical protein